MNITTIVFVARLYVSILMREVWNMKALNIFIFSVLIISFNANATFSLVAYDENSGIYGVAFASCVYLPPNLGCVP